MRAPVSRMKQRLKGPLAAVTLALLAALLDSTRGQTVDACVQDFKQGREDFILDADDSVKEGATYLQSPQLDRYRDCVGACCKDARCNVAFMERGAEEGSITSCFLFDCLYKKKYVCRFVRKKGYLNFIRDSLYESYLAVDVPPSKTRNCLHHPGDVKWRSGVAVPRESVLVLGFFVMDMSNNETSFHY